MMRPGDEKQRARAVRAEFGLSNNGKEQVGVEFELLDRDGALMTWYGSFASDASSAIAINGLRAAGWRGTDLSNLSSLDVSVQMTPEVDLVVGDDEYNGQIRRKIKFINPRGGLAMKAPVRGDALKAFAVRMKGAVLAYDQIAATKQEAAVPRARTAWASADRPPTTADADAAGTGDEKVPF